MLIANNLLQIGQRRLCKQLIKNSPQRNLFLKLQLFVGKIPFSPFSLALFLPLLLALKLKAFDLRINRLLWDLFARIKLRHLLALYFLFPSPLPFLPLLVLLYLLPVSGCSLLSFRISSHCYWLCRLEFNFNNLFLKRGHTEHGSSTVPHHTFQPFVIWVSGVARTWRYINTCKVQEISYSLVLPPTGYYKMLYMQPAF